MNAKSLARHMNRKHLAKAEQRQSETRLLDNRFINVSLPTAWKKCACPLGWPRVECLCLALSFHIVTHLCTSINTPCFTANAVVRHKTTRSQYKKDYEQGLLFLPLWLCVWRKAWKAGPCVVNSDSSTTFDRRVAYR